MDVYLTVKEAAEYLRCAEVTVRRYMKQGMKHYRRGPRVILLRQEDLDEFVLRQQGRGRGQKAR